MPVFKGKAGFIFALAGLYLLTIGLSLETLAQTPEGLTLQQRIKLLKKRQEAKKAKAEQEQENPELNLEFDPNAALSEEERDKLRKQLPEATWQALYKSSTLKGEQHNAITNELGDDKENTLRDLAILWQHAVERSGSVRYAIEKLSSRDASGQPVKRDSFNRKLLQNLAQLGGIGASIWTGTPAGLIGGAMAGELLREEGPQGPGAVTDADMVILTKAINELQQNVMQQYYTYRYAKQQHELASDAYRQLYVHWEEVDKATLEPTTQTAVEQLLRQSHFQAEQAEAEWVMAQQNLTLLVGPEALAKLEAPRD